MPLASRTRRGGNTARRTSSPWGKPKPRKATIVTSPGSTEGGRECPTCKLVVGVRKDGQLRNHRVGKDRRNSWLCPGEEVYT